MTLLLTGQFPCPTMPVPDLGQACTLLQAGAFLARSKR